MNKFFICLIMVLSMASATVQAEMVIIVHPDVSETTLSRKDVQQIFLGKKVQWPDNSAIRVVTVKDPDLHKAFLKQYVKKSLSQWNTYWKRMVFTGQGMPPEQVKTQEALLEYVADTEGAVGYLETDTIEVDNVTVFEVK